MMRMTVLAATLAVLGTATGHAQAEAPAACFEIVPARAGVQPAMLIDKCSGRTWQLTRGRHGGFRWIALARDEREPAAPAAPPAAPAAGTAKCFTFEGRKLCE